MISFALSDFRTFCSHVYVVCGRNRHFLVACVLSLDVSTVAGRIDTFLQTIAHMIFSYISYNGHFVIQGTHACMSALLQTDRLSVVASTEVGKKRMELLKSLTQVFREMNSQEAPSQPRVTTAVTSSLCVCWYTCA
jgi:hypothetical protein